MDGPLYKNWQTLSLIMLPAVPSRRIAAVPVERQHQQRRRPHEQLAPVGRPLLLGEGRHRECPGVLVPLARPPGESVSRERGKLPLGGHVGKARPVDVLGGAEARPLGRLAARLHGVHVSEGVQHGWAAQALKDLGEGVATHPPLVARRVRARHAADDVEHTVRRRVRHLGRLGSGLGAGLGSGLELGFEFGFKFEFGFRVRVRVSGPGSALMRSEVRVRVRAGFTA